MGIEKYVVAYILIILITYYITPRTHSRRKQKHIIDLE